MGRSNTYGHLWTTYGINAEGNESWQCQYKWSPLSLEKKCLNDTELQIVVLWECENIIDEFYIGDIKKQAQNGGRKSIW